MATSDRIDRHAPLEITMQRPIPGKIAKNVTYLLTIVLFDLIFLQVNKRPADDPRLDNTKILRTEDDDMQKLKDRREKKFDDKNKEITSESIRALSGELSTEAIIKLRAKFRAKTRDKIVDLPDEEEEPPTSPTPSPLTLTSEIMQRERSWRNRTTVLQSANKVFFIYELNIERRFISILLLSFQQDFAKNILSILNSVKIKEESEQKQEALAAQRSPIRDVCLRFAFAFNCLTEEIRIFRPRCGHQSKVIHDTIKKNLHHRMIPNLKSIHAHLITACL